MKKNFGTLIGMVSVGAILLFTQPSLASLEECREHFIDGNINNAPTLFDSAPDSPYGSNKHLCYRDDEHSFFAIEYWPEQYAPRWAAYKLSPENYGEKGCNTLGRKKANCYYQTDTWAEYEACSGKGDPFHADYILSDPKLGANDFANTGHDRGHIAPRQAFSWHVCGTYQTFTMANMSPQRAFLNQDIWRYLEQQVLTWAFDEGPIYVVSGATYEEFPADHFSVYKPDGNLSIDNIYKPGVKFSSVVSTHHENYEIHESGELLRPKRNANPDKIRNVTKDVHMPTGYFKVLYRPADGDNEAQAIGFLIPHTFENLNLLTEFYDGLSVDEVFWAFVSNIKLIEDVSGIHFPGIPESLKDDWGNTWYSARRGTGRNIRSSDCGEGSATGLVEDSSLQQRLASCTDQFPDIGQ